MWLVWLKHFQALVTQHNGFVALAHGHMHRAAFRPCRAHSYSEKRQRCSAYYLFRLNTLNCASATCTGDMYKPESSDAHGTTC